MYTFVYLTMVCTPRFRAYLQLHVGTLIGGGLKAPIEAPADLYSFSHFRNADRLATDRLGALRDVSSSGRGTQVTYAEGASEAKKSIGLGLPMSNIYATYFGK